MLQALRFRSIRAGLVLSLLLSVACDSESKPSDGGSDASVCDPCGVNAQCDESTALCVCNGGYSGDGFTCTLNVCAPSCGSNATCQSSGACTCNAGFSGDPIAGCTVSTPPDACHPSPCLNGGTCSLSASAPGGYTCACGSATGTNCEIPPTTSCGTYTDIVYAITARFEIRDAPIPNQSFPGLGTNATAPPFMDTSNTTPFTPTPTFGRGFMRLRFTNDASGKPKAGNVSLVEYYVPLEFHQTQVADVTANTDHSVGLLDSSLANCGGGDAKCADHKPALLRPCTAHGTGTLVGRTLTWDACTPPPSGATTWNYTAARIPAGPGCITPYNAFGNTQTSSVAVPAAGKGDSYQTWSQSFSGIVFSETDLTKATITMPEIQIPNGTGISTTWLAITGSTIVGTDCGSTPGATLVCDLQ